MSRISRASAIFLFSFVLLAVVGTATAQPAPDEQKTWNAEEVQGLADQLAKELTEARHAVRKESGFKSTASGSDRAAQQFDEKLRLLEKSAKQYAARVRGGGGLEETSGIARKVGVQLRDLEVLSRRLLLTKPTLETLKAAQKTINQLSPYYGAAPLYPAVGEGAGS